MSVASHRLEGLEPDNLLAFLALLGLLRALEAADETVGSVEKVRPRVSWDIDSPPLRPTLSLSRRIDVDEVTEHAERGLAALTLSYDFEQRKDLNYSRNECRLILETEVRRAGAAARERADLLAALMSDAAIKDENKTVIDPTPLCLLFGQGHQHFLDRLARVPREVAPPPRGRGKQAVSLSGSQCLGEALFEPWHRSDPTPSFRWDPEEDVRYALMAGDPTDATYQGGTQHGANRLAAIGVGELTLVPQRRGRIRACILGGTSSASGFAFAWPIWREGATLAAIRAMLAHPGLTVPGALAHLGVDHVLIARRISVGKFMNFSRARPLAVMESERGRIWVNT